MARRGRFHPPDGFDAAEFGHQPIAGALRSLPILITALLRLWPKEKDGPGAGWSTVTQAKLSQIPLRSPSPFDDLWAESHSRPVGRPTGRASCANVMFALELQDRRLQAAGSPADSLPCRHRPGWAPHNSAAGPVQWPPTARIWRAVLPELMDPLFPEARRWAAAAPAAIAPTSKRRPRAASTVWHRLWPNWGMRRLAQPGPRRGYQRLLNAEIPPPALGRSAKRSHGCLVESKGDETCRGSIPFAKSTAG